MPKKNEQEEVIETVETDSSIAPLGDAFDYLMQGIIETEVAKEVKFAIPEVYVYMPGKKFTEDGANRGYVISYPDGNKEVNIENLRFARMDAPIGQRTMWDFDAKTGKRLQNEDPKPACASSDGVSARKADYFGFIGKEFVDWRDGQKVQIVADNCKNCPLGQWKETFTAESSWTEPVIKTNYKNQPYTLRSAPPCQELPAYVFFDFDRMMPVLYRTANYTHMKWIVGTNGRTDQRWKQIIKGVEEYYNTSNGTRRPDVSPENGVMFPLAFTTRMVDNAPYGMTPAPQFTLHNTALSVDELNAYATAIQLYRTDDIRRIISGEFWGLGESIANYADDVAGGTAPTTESPW